MWIFIYMFVGKKYFTEVTAFFSVNRNKRAALTSRHKSTVKVPSLQTFMAGINYDVFFFSEMQDIICNFFLYLIKPLIIILDLN